MNKKTDRSSQLEAAPLWWAKAQARTAARNRETDKTHEASSVQPVHPDAQVMSEQRMLQELRNLPTGKDQQFYRRLLTKRGYHIVQVNPEDNHVDFHVERNRQRMVLAVTFDPQSGESRKLAASPLWVERAETDPALDDQEDLQVALLVQELEILPLGRDKAFYRSALRNHGYHITRTVLDQQGVLEVEAVKNDQPVVLTVNFDADSGRSTRVSASPLWWQEQESDQNRQLSQRD